MELDKYIKEVLNKAKSNGAKIVEFDIGLEPLYSEGKVKCIWVNKDSANRVKFSVLLKKTKS